MNRENVSVRECAQDKSNIFHGEKKTFQIKNATQNDENTRRFLSPVLFSVSATKWMLNRICRLCSRQCDIMSMHSQIYVL